VPSKFWDEIPKDWQDLFDKKEIDQIELSVGTDFQPSLGNIFRAFLLPIKKIKVVIVGQDPYPNPAHAMGLAFSVPASEKILPPSLKNIFRELESDLGTTRMNGDLSDWSGQGVLLLNRTLTIGQNGSNSHRNLGWQSITEKVIKKLGAAGNIGVLWGEDAKKLELYFRKDRVLSSVHPSPLSAYRGFFGSKPFSKANAMLIEQGLPIINW
jgi:uracil-DNA glycosylase